MLRSPSTCVIQVKVSESSRSDSRCCWRRLCPGWWATEGGRNMLVIWFFGFSSWFSFFSCIYFFILFLFLFFRSRREIGAMGCRFLEHVFKDMRRAWCDAAEGAMRASESELLQSVPRSALSENGIAASSFKENMWGLQRLSDVASGTEQRKSKKHLQPNHCDGFIGNEFYSLFRPTARSLIVYYMIINMIINILMIKISIKMSQV